MTAKLGYIIDWKTNTVPVKLSTGCNEEPKSAAISQNVFSETLVIKEVSWGKRFQLYK